MPAASKRSQKQKPVASDPAHLLAVTGCHALLKTAFEEVNALLGVFLLELSAHIPPHLVGVTKLGSFLEMRRRRISELVQAKRLYVEIHSLQHEAEAAYKAIVHAEDEIGKIAADLTAAAATTEGAAAKVIETSRDRANVLLLAAKDQLQEIAKYIGAHPPRSARQPPDMAEDTRTVAAVEVTTSPRRLETDAHIIVDQLLQKPLAAAKVRPANVQLISAPTGAVLFFKHAPDASRYAGKLHASVLKGKFDQTGIRLQLRIGITTGPVRVQAGAGTTNLLDLNSPTVRTAKRLARQCHSPQILVAEETFKLLPQAEKRHYPARNKKIRAHTSVASATPAPKRRASPARATLPPVTALHEEPIRILHLSDLHFDRDTNVQSHIHALKQDLLKKVPKPGKVDLVVISGDFRNKGCENGFAKAEQFINQLLKHLVLTADNCVFVPGNHDLAVDGDFYQVHRNEPADAVGCHVKCGEVWVGLHQERGKERWSAYRAFVEKFGFIFASEYNTQCETRDFPAFGIQFICLNSCWMIGIQNLKASGVSADAVVEVTERAQANEAALGHGSSKRGRPLRIGVWHHAVEGKEAMKDVAFVTRLRENLALDFVLHGDVHEIRRALLTHNVSDAELRVIGCGALGAKAEARPESMPQIYNIIEIDREHAGVTVHVRQKKSADDIWTSFAEFLEGDHGSDDTKRGSYHFHLPAKKPRP